MEKIVETYSKIIESLTYKDLLEQLRSLKTINELALFLDEPLKFLTYYLYIIPINQRYGISHIPKKNGGSRVICSPQKGLKRIQRKLNLIFQKLYHNNSQKTAHGFIQNRSIITNAEKHINKRFVLNIDLTDFFPSIHFGRIKGLLLSEHFGLDEKIAHLISNLCCYDGKLPQGAPTSPVLTNMICFKLDSELKKLAIKSKSNYTRYADDITFSTNSKIFPEYLAKVYNSDENMSNIVLSNFLNSDSENATNIILSKELNEIITSNKFEVNINKIRIQNKNTKQEVTGIKVNKKLNVERTYIRNIRAMLHNWENYGLEQSEEKLNKSILYSKHPYKRNPRSFIKVLRGQIDFVGQVKGRYDNIYKNLINKYYKLYRKMKEIKIEEREDFLKNQIINECKEFFQTQIKENNNFLTLKIEDIQKNISNFESVLRRTRLSIKELYKIKGEILRPNQIKPDERIDINSVQVNDSVNQMKFNNLENQVIAIDQKFNNNLNIIISQIDGMNVNYKNLEIITKETNGKLGAFGVDLTQIKGDLKKIKIKNGIDINQSIDYSYIIDEQLKEGLEKDCIAMDVARKQDDFIAFCNYVDKQIENLINNLIKENKTKIQENELVIKSEFPKIKNKGQINIKLEFENGANYYNFQRNQKQAIMLSLCFKTEKDIDLYNLKEAYYLLLNIYKGRCEHDHRGVKETLKYYDEFKSEKNYSKVSEFLKLYNNNVYNYFKEGKAMDSINLKKI
jgi:RNA-directed DNA polymerase